LSLDSSETLVLQGFLFFVNSDQLFNLDSLPIGFKELAFL